MMALTVMYMLSFDSVDPSNDSEKKNHAASVLVLLFVVSFLVAFVAVLLIAVA